MLGNAMDNRFSATPDTPAATSATGQSNVDAPDYPDKLDARLLRIAGICGLVSVMVILDSTVVNVAQRTFITQFGSNQAVVGWTIAGYLLALVTVIPITGWAADRFGTKRLFMGSVLVFTVGSVLCAIAPTVLLLIIFRVIQGIGGGILVPLGAVIVSKAAGPKRLGRLMALAAIPMLLGPVGPILGGWLIGTYGWPSIFLINVPIGSAAFVLAAIVFPKDQSAPADTLDVIGLLLLSPGLAIFLIGVSSIPGRGTVADRQVLIPTIVGAVLIAAFALHAWYRADHPLVDLRLFTNPVVTHANVAIVVFAMAVFGAGLMIPSYFQQALHQSPMESGFHTAPLGIASILAMPIAGLFTDKRGPGKILLIGIPLVAAGMAIFSFGVATHAGYLPTLVTGLIIFGIGMGCSMTPLAAAVIQVLAPHQIARATTLLNVNQQVGGSVGAAVMSVFLTSQLNRGNIGAANKAHAVTGGSADLYASHGFSHAYTAVFILDIAMLAAAVIPAAFLPRKPPGEPQPATG